MGADLALALFYRAYNFNLVIMKLSRYMQEYKKQAEHSSAKIISDKSQMGYFIFLFSQFRLFFFIICHGFIPS